MALGFEISLHRSNLDAIENPDDAQPFGAVDNALVRAGMIGGYVPGLLLLGGGRAMQGRSLAYAELYEGRAARTRARPWVGWTLLWAGAAVHLSSAWIGPSNDPELQTKRRFGMTLSGMALSTSGAVMGPFASGRASFLHRYVPVADLAVRTLPLTTPNGKGRGMGLSVSGRF